MFGLFRRKPKRIHCWTCKFFKYYKEGDDTCMHGDVVTRAETPLFPGRTSRGECVASEKNANYDCPDYVYEDKNVD